VPLREDVDHVDGVDVGSWRRWLEANHATAPAVWLLSWNKGSGRPSITWSEAVDQALCFGWIDTTVRSMGDGRRKQYFTPRSPTGTWSKVNKGKVERLVASGEMHASGLAVIDRAKANGSWDALTDADAHVVPDDLRAALATRPPALATFEAYTPWVKTRTLYRVSSVKRAETRARKIAEIVESAARGERPFGL
jgi:uncharacterized protein YdeI (YjbR/CyaY-like superfamily)